MDGLALGSTLFGLLILSGAFSSSETALFSIPALRLRDMRDSDDGGERAVARAMENPRRILVTILLGNLVVNVLASALGTAFAIRQFGSAGLGVAVATVVMTFLVLVIGEIAPKTVAYRHAEPYARVAARPLLGLSRVLTPVAIPLLRLTELVLGREAQGRTGVGLEEAQTMLRLAHDDGEVDTQERDLVRGVLELGASPVEDAMTPRIEIFSLGADLPVRDARVAARVSGFSKIAVSGADPDQMAGFVTALDLLIASDDATVGDLAREVSWVPEVKPALALLEEFRASGERLALVVDEHGHLSGLVTLTDLLEEISGEMIEGGDMHKVLYERLDRERVMVPARMEIRFFNEEFGTELEAVDSETMAGLVLEHAGRIPVIGDEFRINNIELKVLKAEPNRIVTLEVRILPVEAEGDATTDVDEGGGAA